MKNKVKIYKIVAGRWSGKWVVEIRATEEVTRWINMDIVYVLRSGSVVGRLKYDSWVEAYKSIFWGPVGFDQ